MPGLGSATSVAPPASGFYMRWIEPGPPRAGTAYRSRVRYPALVKRSGSRSEATAKALLEAALKIIRESGVKSVTHRKVCSYAGVALGSSTYHYENLDNLLLDAFAYYVETVSARYEKHFECVTSDDDLVEAMLELVNVMTKDMTNAVLEWELLAAAGREEAYRLLGSKWSSRARSAIEPYVSPQTAHMLEVIWDGATIQRAFNGYEMSEETLRTLFRAALETDPTRSYPVAPAKATTARKAPARKAPAKKAPAKQTGSKQTTAKRSAAKQTRTAKAAAGGKTAKRAEPTARRPKAS